MEYDRSRLKREVKLSMKGSGCMMVTLLFTVVVSAGTWLINLILGRLLTGGVGSISDTVWIYMQQGYEMEQALYIAMLELFRRGPGAIFGAAVGGMVLSILVSLWQDTMDVGYEGWCLSMVRNENPPMGKLFSTLPQFGQVLLTRFLTGVFEVLWALLVGVGYVAVLIAAVLVDVPVLTELLVVADIVLLVLGVIWVTMRYMLVDFLLVDKGLYGMEAVRESKRLMKGNIGKGFVLQLSFFGWYLLLLVIIYAGIALAVIPIVMQLSSAGGLIAASGFALLVLAAVSIGTAVLMLWLKPYITGSMARFYDWTQGAADGFGSGPSGGGDRGWGQPTDYTWTTGPTSGTGMGPAPGNGGPAPKPRDDPWN